VVPNFEGGLTVMNEQDGQGFSIVTLDGTTGQPDSVYTDPVSQLLGPRFAVHPNGTIFAVQGNAAGLSVIGIDPTTGTQKFSVPVSGQGNLNSIGNLIIAGDGNAYVPYASWGGDQTAVHLVVMQIASDGTFNSIKIADVPTPDGDGGFYDANVITNLDQGVLVTWSTYTGAICCDGQTYSMTSVSGTTATQVNAPQVPGQFESVVPLLQAQDGSFVGTVGVNGDDPQYNMIAFDASGNVRWVVPNDEPQMATADGGAIGKSGITYDSNGNATGQFGVSPDYSWSQQWYSSSGGQVADVIEATVDWAVSYQAVAGGNPSSNGTAVGVAEKVEGLPVFAIPLRGSPSCLPPSPTSTRVPLSPAVLQLYTSVRNQWLAGDYLAGPPPYAPGTCGAFFADDPNRANYINQVSIAVTRQLPWDGVQTNISMYDAGMSDGMIPADVAMKKIFPVCSLFVPFHGPHGTVPPTGFTTAASQILVVPPASGPATDVYINTRPKALKYLTQGEILHEALHNLTGLYDFVELKWRSLYGYQPPYDLKTFVGIELTPGVDPNSTGATNDISKALLTNGCAGNQ
jgi:hypothetical protein